MLDTFTNHRHDHFVDAPDDELLPHGKLDFALFIVPADLFPCDSEGTSRPPPPRIRQLKKVVPKLIEQRRAHDIGVGICG